MFILNFHGLGEPRRQLFPGEEEVWVEVSSFEKILDLVRGRNDVGITFDDGNISDVQIALPALLSRGLQAQFFLSAGLLGEPGYLSSGDVADLLAAGMTIGNHGKWHRDWRFTSEEELIEETAVARRDLTEKFKCRIPAVACPFGSYDRRVLRSLKLAGYEAVFTSDGGPSHRAQWLQPRNTVTRDWNRHRLTRVLEAPSLNLTRFLKRVWKRWR